MHTSTPLYIASYSHTHFFFLFHTHRCIHTNNIPRSFIILFFRVKPPRLRSKPPLMWEGVRKACLSACEPPVTRELESEFVPWTVTQNKVTQWVGGGEREMKTNRKVKEPSEHFLTLCKRLRVRGWGLTRGIQSVLTCFGCNWKLSFFLLNVSIKATQGHNYF